jgi:hypothetical protein
MRCEKAAALLLASALVLCRVAGTTGQIKKEATPPPSSEKSLIRKDLLAPRPGELPLPRRNIFSQSYQSPGNVPPPTNNPAIAPPPGQPAVDNRPVQGPSESGLSLSYVGYVRTAKSMIALIVLDGQPDAVREGEMIRPGFKLVKITPQGIEVSGPDSKTQKFSLKGGEGED